MGVQQGSNAYQIRIFIYVFSHYGGRIAIPTKLSRYTQSLRVEQ